MPRPAVLESAAEVGTVFADGNLVSVSSSSGLGCPDAVLAALGEHFHQTGTPRDLVLIHPIAAGDMYGVKGVDRIAQPGLIARIIAGSYPSGPSSAPTPRIWSMVDNDEIEAWNLPSGIIFHMLREGSAKRPGVLTKVGLGTFVDPRRQGGRMNRRTTATLVEVEEFRGEEWLFYPALTPDVSVVRATTADTNGNLAFRREGAYLGAYEQALAARNNGGTTIAQVSEIVPAGSLPMQTVRVPGILVDHLFVDPDQRQTTQTDYDPAISGETTVDVAALEPITWSPEKVIARRTAQELADGQTVNLGFGISALVPYILLEEGLDGSVTWVIEQGAVGGLPLLGFQFGCAVNAQALVPSPDQFTYFQGAGFDQALLSFLEIDREGNVNVSRIAARPAITAGAGGFIDITAHARKIVFSGTFTTAGLNLEMEDRSLHIRNEGKVQKFVDQVEHVTFSGRHARERGQDVTVVTERCVLRLGADGWTVTEIAPGVDFDRDVQPRCGFRLHRSPDIRSMDPSLFAPEPINLKLQPAI